MVDLSNIGPMLYPSQLCSARWSLGGVSLILKMTTSRTVYTTCGDKEFRSLSSKGGAKRPCIES